MIAAKGRGMSDEQVVEFVDGCKSPRTPPAGFGGKR